MHSNCRTLYANFTNIKGCLRQFKKLFNIVAMSETWINTERGLDLPFPSPSSTLQLGWVHKRTQPN